MHSTQDIVSFLVGILILGVLIHSYFKNHNRGNISTSLFHMLIWIFIMLLLIVGYAFRYELQIVADRVLIVLMPGRNWDKNGQIIVAKSADSHFYLDTVINSQEVRFLVDTGATEIALSLQDAKTIGIDLSTIQYTRRYNTANGVSLGAPIILDKITIGDITIRNIPAHVMQEGADSVSLLGMSALKKFKTVVIQRDKLVLEY
jgi:aspartyl protease family protein